MVRRNVEGADKEVRKASSEGQGVGTPFSHPIGFLGSVFSCLSGRPGGACAENEFKERKETKSIYIPPFITHA